MGYGFRPSSSPLATIEWWADVEADYHYTEAASEFWGFAFGVLADSSPTATLIGPATAPREMHMTAGERHWGVELPPHVFLRGVGPKPLDELRELPTDGRWFELAGVRYSVPDLDGAPRLLDALAAQGVLVAEPTVADALHGTDVGYSERSVRRMVTAAAGVGRKDVEQLRRARHAYRLLTKGASLSAAAAEAGYADQAHMTRSFRAFAGMSPGRILAGDPSPFDSRPA